MNIYAIYAEYMQLLMCTGGSKVDVYRGLYREQHFSSRSLWTFSSHSSQDCVQRVAPRGTTTIPDNCHCYTRAQEARIGSSGHEELSANLQNTILWTSLLIAYCIVYTYIIAVCHLLSVTLNLKNKNQHIYNVVYFVIHPGQTGSTIDWGLNPKMPNE